MSYDIRLLRFVDGGPQANPAGRVHDLLREAAARPPDEDGYARVVWQGGQADAYGVPRAPDEPVDSVMFSRPAEDDRIFDLIVEVARAGDMTILLPDGVACLVDGAHADQLPPDLAGWPRHLVRSGQDLARVIREL